MTKPKEKSFSEKTFDWVAEAIKWITVTVVSIIAALFVLYMLSATRGTQSDFDNVRELASLAVLGSLAFAAICIEASSRLNDDNEKKHPKFFAIAGRRYFVSALSSMFSLAIVVFLGLIGRDGFVKPLGEAIGGTIIWLFFITASMLMILAVISFTITSLKVFVLLIGRLRKDKEEDIPMAELLAEI